MPIWSGEAWPNFAASPSGASVIDVLSGRRSIHEVLLRGPVGVLVVPGVWAAGGNIDCSATAQQRLIDQLRGLAVHADVVVDRHRIGTQRLCAPFLASGRCAAGCDDARAGRHHGMLRHDQSAAGGHGKHCRPNADQSRPDRRASHRSATPHRSGVPTIFGRRRNGCRSRARGAAGCCRRPRRPRPLCSARRIAKRREPWNDWQRPCGRSGDRKQCGRKRYKIPPRRREASPAAAA